MKIACCAPYDHISEAEQQEQDPYARFNCNGCGSPVRVPSDHLAFFDPEAGHFVRLRDDLLHEPIFIFFHLWRDIEA